MIAPGTRVLVTIHTVDGTISATATLTEWTPIVGAYVDFDEPQHIDLGTVAATGLTHYIPNVFADGRDSLNTIERI